MKYHLLSTGTKLLAEASPFDPVWGIGLRADDPEARDPRLWRGKHLLGKTLRFATPFAPVRPGCNPSLVSAILHPDYERRNSWDLPSAASP